MYMACKQCMILGQKLCSLAEKEKKIQCIMKSPVLYAFFPRKVYNLGVINY